MTNKTEDTKAQQRAKKITRLRESLAKAMRQDVQQLREIIYRNAPKKKP